MKIVILIDWFIYYTVELANALSQEHDVMLVTRDHNYELSSSFEAISIDDFLDACLIKKVNREKLRYRQRSLKNFLEVIRVYKRVRSFRPDIIHIQENTDWRILLIAKMLGFEKAVLTVHDVQIHPGDPEGILKYFKSVLRKKVRKIIVHGQFLKKQLASNWRVPEDKIYILPHGAFSIYKKWDDPSIKEEAKTILFFGRISRYKGLDILIKAEPLITQHIPDAKIVIAGSGEDFGPYESLITNRSRFEIHNRFISHRDVPKFFRRASVVVLPYIEASQSGVVPIAYIFGKPVVVTNVGSIPEVVDEGKTGFIVPPNSPEDLSRAIIEILENHELRKTMSANALAKASTELSWNTIAQETAKIYSLN